MGFDSQNETLLHIGMVQKFVAIIVQELLARALCHDGSKLQEPEKRLYDIYTPLLRGTTYGSEEYRQHLAEMREGLSHHYEHNRHHPEHYPNGVDGMTLIDILEMFCDWKAATLRHADGSFRKSINHNRDRFDLSPQLHQIFLNTAHALGWLEDV